MNGTMPLDPQQWLEQPPVKAVLPIIHALEKAGEKARFVGGCVRDAILGRPLQDIDLATSAHPECSMRILRAQGYRVVPTGLAHGTVTVVLPGGHVEVTTLRRDVETDGRHATVAFTDDWLADAARRDLTINALSVDADGRLYDPFDGISDLREGRVRFVGDPRQRIQEDVLRILRFFRFHAWYGHAQPDHESLKACLDMAGLIPRLSAERIFKEWVKLLSAPDPAACCRLMLDGGVTQTFLPEIQSCDLLGKLNAVTFGVEYEHLGWLRMAALLPVDTDMRSIGKRMKWPDKMTRFVDAVLRNTPPARADMPLIELHQSIEMRGAAVTQGQLLLSAAQGRGQDRLTSAWAEASRWKPPVRPYGGDDLQQMGMIPGPALGQALSRMDAWWRSQDYQPDRAACLAYMRHLVMPGQASF